MMSDVWFESARNKFGKFIYQLQPKTETLVRKLERILIKLHRQNMPLLFNLTYLNERLLPNKHKIYTRQYISRNFGKELEFLPLLVPLPQLLASGPLQQPLTAYVFWYLPPPGTQERRTHVLSLKEQDTHTVKFQQAFYLQTFKHPHKTFTLPTKPTLPSTFTQQT